MPSVLFVPTRRDTKSLLLWEKVAAARLTDEESFASSTSSTAIAVPLPPLGKAVYMPRKVHLFFLTMQNTAYLF